MFYGLRVALDWLDIVMVKLLCFAARGSFSKIGSIEALRAAAGVLYREGCNGWTWMSEWGDCIKTIFVYLFRFYKPLFVEQRLNRVVWSRDGESCEHADWNTLIESFGTAMRVWIWDPGPPVCCPLIFAFFCRMRTCNSDNGAQFLLSELCAILDSFICYFLCV